MSRKPADRRDALKAMFAGQSKAAPQANSAPAETKPHARSGAVKAMGLQLEGLGAKLDETTGQGERVVEIDPDLIDSAFVADRLAGAAPGDEGFDELAASIRDGGQQVPVLLRRHADEPGRYQTAYGHRRIAACRQVGVPVRAIIRDLSDSDLVLAQGRENALRRDLSFIEKARFAADLVQRGFARADVQRALALHAADMTRMLAVASAVPAWAAIAVGPAGKAGRARWMALAKALETAPARAKARKVIASEAFRALASDARFAAVFKAVTQSASPKETPEVLKDRKGRAVATRTGSAARPSFTINAAAAPQLAADIAALIARHEGAGS